VLNINVDTSGLDVGNYSLALRQVGWGGYRYPLRLA